MIVIVAGSRETSDKDEGALCACLDLLVAANSRLTIMTTDAPGSARVARWWARRNANASLVTFTTQWRMLGRDALSDVMRQMVDWAHALRELHGRTGNADSVVCLMAGPKWGDSDCEALGDAAQRHGFPCDEVSP